MKGKTLNSNEHDELLGILLGMHSRLGWLLKVNPKSERWEFLVDSDDIQELSKRIQRIAEISNLQKDIV